MGVEEFAIRAHGVQVDKIGKPYWLHAARVAANFVPDTPAYAVAWLHDVVEDTDVQIDDIHDLFGDEIADAVAVLSRNLSPAGDAYYERIRKNPVAYRVKLQDIADNLDPHRVELLPAEDAKRLQKKYAHALEVLNG